MNGDASSFAAAQSADAVQPGDRDVCVCGGDIVWRLRPMLPFPDVASERQLARQGTGRWVHDRPYQTDEKASWCSPRQAHPAPKERTDG